VVDTAEVPQETKAATIVRLEKCENCGRVIGAIEVCHLWNGNKTVCEQCHSVLLRPAPAVYSPSPTQTVIASASPTVIQVNAPKSFNAMAIVAVIFAAVALPLGVIPGCGLAAVPLALLGLLLGIASFGFNASYVASWTAVILSLIPLVIQGAIILLAVFSSAPSP
jgi:hypothetical protein